MSNINKIVNVNIDVNSPAVSGASFDNLLIVGPAPAKPENDKLPNVGIYYDLQSVEDEGYVSVGIPNSDASEFIDPVGAAARIAFAQTPPPSRIYIANIPEDGDVIAVLNAALKTQGWYVICGAGIDEKEFADIAAWTEAQRKMFAYTYLSGADPVDAVYYRSFGFCGKEYDDQPETEVFADNAYIHIAETAKCLNYPAGSETWAYKQLSGVKPSEFSGAFENSLEAGNTNYFTRLANKNGIMPGKTKAGEWIDIIRFRDWLENDMQFRVLNLLLTNKKIPYTDEGIGLVQNQMIASLKAGRAAGGVAPDEYDEDGGVIPGFATSAPLAASLTQSQKASRTLANCRFTARLAGAIHIIKIDGNLRY